MCETKREIWREKKKENISNRMSKFTKRCWYPYTDPGERQLVSFSKYGEF